MKFFFEILLKGRFFILALFIIFSWQKYDKFNTNTIQKTPQIVQNAKSYHIIIDPLSFERFSLTYSDILNALKESDFKLNAEIPLIDKNYIIEATSSNNSLKNIKNSVIKVTKDKVISIKDIAIVKEKKYATPIPVIEEKKQEILNHIIKIISPTLIIGIIGLIFIIFLSLFSLRAVIIILFSLILSFLALVILLEYYQISFSLIMLMASLIFIVITLEMSINMMENIFRKRHENPHKDPIKVIIHAIRELSPPILVLFFILIIILFSLFIVKGIFYLTFKPILLACLFMLLISIIISLIIVPLLSSLLFQKTRPLNFFMKLALFLYLPLLNTLLKHPKKVFIVVSLGMIYTIILFISQHKIIKYAINTPSITYHFTATVNTTTKQTQINAQDIQTFILKNYPQKVKKIKFIIKTNNSGKLFLDLNTSLKTIHSFQKNLLSELRVKFNYLHIKNIPSLSLKIQRLLKLQNEEITLYIKGQNKILREKLSIDILSLLKEFKEVKNIYHTTPLEKDKITIILKPTSLVEYGFTINEVKEFITYAILGKEIIQENKAMSITTSLHKKRPSIDEIKKLKLYSKNGKSVILEEICKIAITPQQTNSFSQFSIETDPQNSAVFVTKLLKIIKKSIVFPKGYNISVEGDFKEIELIKNNFLIILFLVLLFIFLAFHLIFHSFKTVFLILCVLPLGLIGILLSFIFQEESLYITLLIETIFLCLFLLFQSTLLLYSITKNCTYSANILLEERIRKILIIKIRPMLISTFAIIFTLLPTLYYLDIKLSISHSFSMLFLFGMLGILIFNLFILPPLAVLIFEKTEKKS